VSASPEVLVATPSAPDHADAQGGGWRIIAAKEFADHLNSVRFLLLTLGLGLAAVGAVYATAGGIRDVAPAASGSPALFLIGSPMGAARDSTSRRMIWKPSLPA